MASNDPNDTGRSPDRVGVYSTTGGATGGTTAATGTTTGSHSTSSSIHAGSAGMGSAGSAGMGSAAVDRTAAGASSATRWLIPALVVALIILALLWWL